MKNKMDRYFYLVELDEDGNKVIHLSGNVYWNDIDNTKCDYTYDEWVWFYVTLDEILHGIRDNWLFDHFCEHVKYSGGITEKEAIETCEQYFDGKPGTHLSIGDVNEETPCGGYWFDRSEIM